MKWVLVMSTRSLLAVKYRQTLKLHFGLVQSSLVLLV